MDDNSAFIFPKHYFGDNMPAKSMQGERSNGALVLWICWNFHCWVLNDKKLNIPSKQCEFRLTRLLYFWLVKDLIFFVPLPSTQLFIEPLKMWKHSQFRKTNLENNILKYFVLSVFAKLSRPGDNEWPCRLAVFGSSCYLTTTYTYW